MNMELSNNTHPQWLGMLETLLNIDYWMTFATAIVNNNTYLDE